MLLCTHCLSMIVQKMEISPKKQSISFFGGDLDLSRKQCSLILCHTIIPGNPDKLKPNAMKSQAKMTKRLAITIAQQFCWYTRFEAGLNKLCELNTREFNLTGKTFGELIWHFVIGDDETCILSSSIHLHDIGSTGQNKHEKILRDSRFSITMYCTSSVERNTGTTVFHVEGERVQSSFNE